MVDTIICSGNCPFVTSVVDRNENRSYYLHLPEMPANLVTNEQFPDLDYTTKAMQLPKMFSN